MLRLTALAALTLLCVCAVGLVFDARTIGGVPSWAKPAKFSLSIALYALSLAWMIGFVRHHRALRLLAATIAVALWLELAIILAQVLRGTTSHFNLSTPLDAGLFAAMGVAITFLWMAHLAVTCIVSLKALPDALIARGLRLGLIVSLIGLAQGGLMLLPTPLQRAEIAAHVFAGIIGAHSVGLPDGASGLPITGWNVAGGDLRVGHFLGLHALQVIPLLAYGLRRRQRWLSTKALTNLLSIAGAAYLGLVVLATVQALRGEAPLAPSGTMLRCYAAWALTTFASCTFVSVRARRGRDA